MNVCERVGFEGGPGGSGFGLLHLRMFLQEIPYSLNFKSYLEQNEANFFLKNQVFCIFLNNSNQLNSLFPYAYHLLSIQYIRIILYSFNLISSHL
jgi:hypothetical protein